ncbi:uncharacterized protein [Apostichopus japonicus]|uniref:uncharacterized protein isoform X3 n=1 Tax=Stichopus japonicus TaxID=307972 RepID=UPI003AB90E99
MDATPRASKLPRPSSQARSSLQDQEGRQSALPSTKSGDTSKNQKTSPLVQQLRGEIRQLKRQIDEEASHVKNLKREKIKDVQKARDEEQGKTKNALSDLRYRLSQEKDRELESLKAQLAKQHGAEISKILREKDAFTKANKEASKERSAFIQRLQEDARTEVREEMKMLFSSEKTRFKQEIEELNKNRKRLEEDLAKERLASRGSSEDLRRLNDEHQREMEQLRKEARKDIIILIDEIKAKDRIVAELEKELGHQTGYAQTSTMEKSPALDRLNLTKLRDTWEKKSSQNLNNSKRNASGIESFSLSSSSLEDSKKSAKDVSRITEKEDNSHATQTKNVSAKKSLSLRKGPLPRGSPVPSENSQSRRSLPKLGPPSRASTPTRQVTDSLQRRLQESEASQKRLERKCKMLEGELNRSKRDHSKRPQSPWTTEKMDQLTKPKASKKRPNVRKGMKDDAGLEEELGRIRRQMDEQFEEIVELKQAAMVDKKRQLFGRRNSLPSETQSEFCPSLNSSLAFSEADGIHSLGRPLSRSDFESRESLSMLTATDSKWGSMDEDVKELKSQLLQMETSQEILLSELHESKEQNELLEFQLLEATESDQNHGEDLSGLPGSTTELLREVLKYMQTYEGKDVDFSEIKQKVDEISQEKIPSLDSDYQDSVENLKSILAFSEIKFLQLQEKESELQSLMDEKMEEVQTLADELTQLLPKLEEKDEIIKVTNKKLDELLENEFDLVEKVKDYETQVAVLQEELIELRERSTNLTDARGSATVKEDLTHDADGDRDRSSVEKEVQVCLSRRRRVKKRAMSSEEDSNNSDGSDISFSDDDSISGLLPDEDGAANVPMADITEVASNSEIPRDGPFTLATEEIAESRNADCGNEQTEMGERICVLEEENSKLISEKRTMEDQETNLREIISNLERKVKELEKSGDEMSEINDQHVDEIQGLRKEKENYISKEDVETQEKELRNVIEELQQEQKVLVGQLQQMERKVNEQSAMIESGRKLMEDHLQDSESEKKLLQDALEKEKTTKTTSSQVDTEGDNIESIKYEIKTLEFVLKDLQEKQKTTEGLVEDLSSEEQSLKHSVANMTEEKLKLEETIHGLSKQKTEMEDNMKEKKGELEKILEEKNQLAVRDNQELEDLLKEVQSLNEQRTADICNFEEEIKQREEKIEGLTREKVELMTKMEKFESENKNTVEEQEKKIDELMNEKGVLYEKLEDMQKHVINLESSHADKDAKLLEMEDVDKQKLEKSVEILSNLQKELKEMEDKNTALTAHVTYMEGVEDTNKILQSEKTSLETSNDQLSTENTVLEDKLISLEKKILQWERSEREHKQKKESNDARILELEGLLANSQESSHIASSLQEEVSKLELDLVQQKSDSKAEIEKLIGNMNMLIESNDDLKAKLENAGTNADKLQNQLLTITDESRKKVFHLEAELEREIQYREKLDKAKRTLEKDFSSLKESLSSSIEENGKLTQEIELLKLPSKGIVIEDAGNEEYCTASQERPEEAETQDLCNREQSQLNAAKEDELVDKTDQESNSKEDQTVKIERLMKELEIAKGRELELLENVEHQVHGVQALQEEVENLKQQKHSLEENESKLIRNLMDKDAELQMMTAKEIGLERKLKNLHMSGAGLVQPAKDQNGEAGDLEGRKIKIGELEDELERIKQEGEDLFGTDETDDDETSNDSSSDQTGQIFARGGLQEDSNFYSVVEQQVWEEVQISVTTPVAVAPPSSSEKTEKFEERGFLNQRIEMLEAEVRSQKDLLQEETLAKEKLQEEIWGMLQSETDLRDQLSTLQEQNEGLMSNLDCLKELEVEIDSMRALVEKLSQEKRQLEMQVKDAELSRNDNKKMLEDKVEELEKMKEEADTIDDERKKLMEKVREMEANMQVVADGLTTGESLDLLVTGNKREKMEESLKDEIDKLEKRNNMLEEQLECKTRISLDTSEMDSLLFSSEDESESDRKADETLEEKVKRLEKLNQSLKVQVRQLLTFHEIEAALGEGQSQDTDDGKADLKAKHESEVPNDKDSQEQLASSEEKNKYLEQQLENLRQLMQDGGFENQDMLIEKVEILEKSQRQLLKEIEMLKEDLTDKEDELRNTQSELMNTETKFSERVGELERSEQRLLDKLEANNEEWRIQSERSMERINELENVRGELRKQLSGAEEQLEEMQASRSLGNLGSTHQSGLSLLDEGLGALDIGRNSFEEFEDDIEEEENDRMQREMENAIRGIEEDVEDSRDLKEENDRLVQKIEELEKSEIELMEKVDILAESEKKVLTLCEKLKEEVEEKTSEIKETRKEMEMMNKREAATKSEEDLEGKADALREEVKHLQEQITFMEEERDALLSKVEELSQAKHVEVDSPKRTQAVVVEREPSAGHPNQVESRIEIDVMQWQGKSLEKVEQVEMPIRVRTVAPYNSAMPYRSLHSDGNIDGYLEDAIFFEKVHSEKNNQTLVERHFEERIFEQASEEEASLTSADISDECSFGENELDVAMQRSLVSQNTQVILNNFEEGNFRPRFSDDDTEGEKSSTSEFDEEEEIKECCDEPLFGKEEVVPVHMDADLFAFQQTESKHEMIQMDGTENDERGDTVALRNRIEELENSEKILLEKVQQLEEIGEQLADTENTVTKMQRGFEEELKMKNRIKELEDNEDALNVRIEELEVMQSAFEETLGQADAIMREREAEYLQKIEDLENEQSLWRNLERMEDNGAAETSASRHPPQGASSHDGEMLTDVEVDDEEGGGLQIQMLQERIEELENSEMKLMSELEESLTTEKNLEQETQRLEGLVRDLEGNKERERSEELRDDAGTLRNTVVALEEEKVSCMALLTERDNTVEDLKQKVNILEEENNCMSEETERLLNLDKEREEKLMKQGQDLEDSSKTVEEQIQRIKSLEEDLETTSSLLILEEENVQEARKELETLRKEKEEVCENLRKQLEENLTLSKQVADRKNEIGRDDDTSTYGEIHPEDNKMKPDDKEDDSVIHTDEDLQDIQEELHLANIHIEDLKRSKIALEEQLKKVRQNLHSNNMVTLPEEEYQQLRARAQSVDGLDDPEELMDSSNDSEQFANAGKLWVKLDQTTKELRKYQELYNTTMKEVGHLKQALREVSEKHEAYLQGRRGSLLIDTVALPTADAGLCLDHKLVQTQPLKTVTSETLKLQLVTTGNQHITLQELLGAIPEPTELSQLPGGNYPLHASSMMNAGNDVFFLQSPSPIKAHPLTSDVLSESFLNTSMWPPELGLHEKENTWKEIQSALATEEFSDAPPLPSTLPPRASSNLSVPDSPDMPPLPGQPPPVFELSFSTHDGSLPVDEIDLDVSEVEKMTSNDQIEATQSNQSAAPPVATKPDAPDWLKDVKMEEWAKLMDETEQMKVKVRDLEDEIEAKDEQLGNLQQEKVDLALKARGAEDALCYKEKLQERELDLKEKEKQITRLKGEMKKKDAESTPLKLQLERLQDQFKDKEQSLRLLEAEQIRLKQTLTDKDRALFSKEREVEELGERLKHLPDGEMKKEGDENWKSEKEYLQEQNGRLMKQVDQLEPLKERMMNLQSQLEIGLSTQEDKGSLIKKLEQAEKLIEEKTAEELRLLEDNHCLQKRIDKLEREKNFQDGLEVEYENMKEQFNDLESKKHEAELSVAPLKAKVAYLLKQFQVKDGTLRKMAAQAAVSNPERASEIFEEIESLKDQLPIYELSVSDRGSSVNARKNRSRNVDVMHDDVSKVSLEDHDDDGEITLQELIREASKPTTGKVFPCLGASDELMSPLLLNGQTVGRRDAGRMQDRTRGKTPSPVASDDTLQRLVQSDADDSIDFPVGRSKVRHLNQHSVSAPPSHIRPPLMRTRNNDFGSADPPSSTSSLDRGHSLDTMGNFSLPSDPVRIGVDEGGTGVSAIRTPGGSTGMNNGQLNIPRGIPGHGDTPRTYHQTEVPPLPNGFPPTSGANIPSQNVYNQRPVQTSLHFMTPPRVPPAPVHHLSNSASSSSLPSSHIRPFSGPSWSLPVPINHSIPPDPPYSLSVDKRVGKTSALLVWQPPPLDDMTRNNGQEIAGYKIYVNGQLKQLVTSPRMTKALVTNLNLKVIRTFGIQTVSLDGNASPVRQVSFTLPQSDVSVSGMSDSSLSDSAREPSTEASSSMAGERSKQRMFMAVYSYNPMEHSPNETPEKELSFKEGDMIRVQGHMRKDGFYHGSVNGIKGLVPSNFIEEVSISSSGKRKKTMRDVIRRRPDKRHDKTEKGKFPSKVHSRSGNPKV